MGNTISFDSSSPEIVYLKKKDKRLAKVIEKVGSITCSNHDGDEYSFFIHEIIEQMLSIKAGKKIYNRLEELCGGEITPEAVAHLSVEQIRSTGTSSAKVSYIRGITDAVISGELQFDTIKGLSDKDVIKSLTAFKGIGNWTAKMYLLFVLNRPDVLPFEDGAFQQSYKWMYKTSDISSASISKKCEKWKPYSSIAARYLYRALDLGLTKNEFHLYKEI